MIARVRFPAALMSALLAALLMAPVFAAGEDEGASPPAPLVDALQPFRHLMIRGGIAAGATCASDNDPAYGGPYGGVIDITGIPPGATVIEAWMWYVVLDTGQPVSPGSPTVNGVPVPATPLGQLEWTPCFPDQVRTGSFRADVSAVVTGNGSYSLAGLPSSPSGWYAESPFSEGATIVAIYSEPGGPFTEVTIFDGLDVIDTSRPDHEQTLTGFGPVPAPVSAVLVAVAGNGQLVPDASDPDEFYVNGTLIETLYPPGQVLAGSACPYKKVGGWWDLGLYDISSLVLPGATSLTMTARVESDCYSFAACVLAVNRDPVTAVTYGAAEARRERDGVRVAWTALSETGTLGYEIRVRDASGEVRRLPVFVPAAGAGSRYEAIDGSGEARAGNTAAYRVEEVSSNGPGCATQWLPVLSAASVTRGRGGPSRPHARFAH